jgi:hypothetical protein
MKRERSEREQGVSITMYSEHLVLDPNGHAVQPNEITYFAPGKSFSIYNFAGPPTKGTVVYIRNPTIHNDQNKDFNNQSKWIVTDSYESIVVQGTKKDSYQFPNVRTFEVYIDPYGGIS